MPIQDHPSFSEPEPDARLWRYMEFAKYVSMLTTGGLWFSNADILAQNDPFEGCLPNPHFHNWTDADLPPELILQLTEHSKTDEQRRSSIDGYLRVMSMQPAIALHMRKTFLVSCWHSSPHESAAMWKAYGKHDGGIAITTSLSKLREAFKNATDPLYCGQIQYIDFETGVVPTDNLFNAILRKRQSFQSENEIRIVCSDYGPIETEKRTAALDGKLIPCSLNALIDEIWISPAAPAWFAGTVEAFSASSGFRRNVRRSTLLDQPATPPVAYPA